MTAPSRKSAPSTATALQRLGTLLALCLLAMISAGCSTVSPPSPPLLLPQPAVLTQDSPDSLTYSERARAWLKKARDTLTSFEPSGTP